MKVMHVTFDMRIGGTEMVIKNIIEGNDEADIEMSIFCIEAPLGPWGEELSESGISITSCVRQPGFDSTIIKAIRAKIKSEDIDIVHCHQYTPWVYGAMAAAFTRAKVIFTEHGRFYPDSSSWKRKIINPLLLSLTSECTAISEATRIALAEFEGLPKHRINLIYNGISPITFSKEGQVELKKRLSIPEGSLVLGTIARFDPIKNHKMMLNAFKEVIQHLPNTILIMVGDGEERGNIEHLISKLQLTQHVILPGYQSNPSEFLACMDIFLLSSLSEGTSMTLLEAMSLGKPCVVTDAGGNKEIIEHGTNGFVTANDEAQAFAKAIVELVLTEQCLTFGSNAKRRFSSLFSITKMFNEYKILWNKMLQC